MKITTEALTLAFGQVGLEVQYFPLRLKPAQERKPHTCGSIDLNKIAEAVNAIPAIAMIESMQLIGVKNGREVDLGDVPLSPEMKAREIARQYGNPDDEDDLEAGAAIGAMTELIDWLKKQKGQDA